AEQTAVESLSVAQERKKRRDVAHGYAQRPDPYLQGSRDRQRAQNLQWDLEDGIRRRPRAGERFAAILRWISRIEDAGIAENIDIERHGQRLAEARKHAIGPAPIHRHTIA